MLRSNLKTFVFLVAPYSITVSTLYLFGYWGSFDVNIFDFIDIADILKIAIYQMARYGAVVILSLILTELFLAPILELLERFFPPGSGASSPEGKFFNKYWRLFLLPFVAYALYVGYFTDFPLRWIFVAFILIPLVHFAVSNTALLVDSIPNKSLRNSI